MYHLSEEDIRKSIGGKLWIIKKRQKASIQFRGLLLNIAKLILSKYKDKMQNICQSYKPRDELLFERNR